VGRRLDSRRVGRPRAAVCPPHSRAVEPYPIARVVADELAPILVKLTRAVVREELRASGKAGEDDTADPWVPHSRWPFCSSRRAACALARSGAIDGVHKVGAGRGAVWLARRSALENYVLAHGAPVAVAGDVKPANDEPTVDSILAAAGRRRRGAR
jgi:hypothetical protein